MSEHAAVMLSNLPYPVIRQVASHLSRRTLVLLSRTSAHIRRAILPLVFRTLALYGIGHSAIQKCNITLQPATLSSFRGFRFHVGVGSDANATPWLVDFDTETLCAFSNLLASMRNLRIVTLDLDFARAGAGPVQMTSISAAREWSFIVRLLSRNRALQGGKIVIKFKLHGVFLKNDEDVLVLANLLEKLAPVTISHLFIEVDGRSQEESFGSVCLQKLQSYKHIKNVEIVAEGYESMFGLAANLPTTILRVEGPFPLEGWNTPRSPSTLTFANLRSIELDCRDDSYAVYEILSFLQAPQLQTVYLDAMDTSGSAIILGAMFKSFLDRCTLLKNIKIGVIPGEDPWSSVQTRLEDLRLYVTDLGKRLCLEVVYWETWDDHAPALAKTGQAVPLSEPLQGHIEALSLTFDEDSRLPMYRANRVQLPSVRELALYLMRGPKVTEVLHWYLDGLDLPGLARLTVKLGCRPATFQHILAHLPLLPSSCSISLQFASEWPLSTVRAFRSSVAFASLKTSCLSLGRDLRIEGEYCNEDVMEEMASPLPS